MEIMVDIETLSTDIKSGVITSIGACRFDLTGVKDRFKVNIDVASSKAHGLKTMPSTVEWWKTQSPAAIKAWTQDPKPLTEALALFETWINDDRAKDDGIWANGIDFDFPMLRRSYEAVGKDLPWKYWVQRDCRTIFSIFGLRASELRKTDDTLHGALQDVVFQAETLIDLLKVFEQ